MSWLLSERRFTPGGRRSTRRLEANLEAAFWPAGTPLPNLNVISSSHGRVMLHLPNAQIVFPSSPQYHHQLHQLQDKLCLNKSKGITKENTFVQEQKDPGIGPPFSRGSLAPNHLPTQKLSWRLNQRTLQLRHRGGKNPPLWYGSDHSCFPRVTEMLFPVAVLVFFFVALLTVVVEAHTLARAP